MEIFAACPFAVSTLAWEPAPGRRSLSVCIKGTFALAPGAVATIAPLQEPVAAEAAGGDPAAALGELTPFKPRAEILLTGHAHAPRGAPTDTLIARARVGSFRKALSITGDRTWVPSGGGLRPSVAVPFRRMPLRYERAVRAGENLGGVDVMAQGAELGRALPNIAAIADQGGETPGFGPLPLSWRARRHGLSDAGILWASRLALTSGPPPAGFDFRVLNAAPSEQQLEEIPPGVEILLENLHPEHARLETRLPVLRVRLFRLAPRGERSTEMPVRCDTLAIDTDRGLAFVLWRGAVLMDAGDEATVGRLVITAEAEGERIGPEHADRLFAQLAPPVTYLEAGPALGRASGSTRPEPRRSSYPPPPRAPTPPVGRPATVADETRGPGAGGLPFRAPPTGFENMPLPTLARDSYPPPPPPGQALVAPPGPAGKGTIPPAPRPPSWGPHDDDGEVTPPRGHAALIPTPAPQPERTANGTIVPPASAPPPRAAGGTIRPPPSTPPPPPLVTAPPADPPKPPARPTEEHTPVNLLERTASGTIRPPPSTAFAGLPFVRPAEVGAAADDDGADTRATPPPPAPAVVGDEGIGLSAYCAVKVDVWRTEAPLSDVLDRHGIDEAAFRAYERAQNEALAREAAAGRTERATALLQAMRAARGAGG